MKRWEAFMGVVALSLVTAALAVVAGCGGEDDEATGTPAAETGATDRSGPPYVVETEWGGRFELTERIAEKLENGEPLNIAYSFPILTAPLTPVEAELGMERAAENAREERGIDVNVRLVGPPNLDPPAQIAEIETLVNAGQVDCLGILGLSPDAYVDPINKILDQGVPFFTVDVDNESSRRLAYFGIDQKEAASLAGDFSVDYFEENGITPQEIGILTGDPAAEWAEQRTEGFLDAVVEAYPDVQLVGSPQDRLDTSFDPAKVVSTTEAYLNGHPNTNIVWHTDQGVEGVGSVISRSGRKGEVWAVGFNVGPVIFDLIEDDVIIATVDQGWHNQTEAFVNGCLDFLLDGWVPTEPKQILDAILVTKDNLEEARQFYQEVHGGGS